MVYTLQLISQNKVILATIQSNSANILNESSLQEWNDLMDEIESPSNKALYFQKPIIFTSGSNIKSFSAGMDIKSILKANTKSSFIKLFDLLENTIKRIMTLQHRTIALLDGHTIAGGFFLALACDVRCGLNNDKIKIGITEIDVGIPFQSLTQLLIQTRIPIIANKILISQPNKLMKPKEAYKYGFITELVDDRDVLFKLCVKEAIRIHPDSMNAYLSVKNYLFEKTVNKVWIKEHGDATNEVARVALTESSQRRLKAMNDKLTKTRSKL